MTPRTKKQYRSMAKKRFANLLIFLLLAITEIFIALFVHDGFIRPFAGDILIVAVIYYFVRIFFPVGIKYLWVYVFIFATLIEIAQLVGLTQIASGDSRFLQILLGTSFSIWDILCYAVGCAIIWIIERRKLS